jgi:hypothetical protein
MDRCCTNNRVRPTPIEAKMSFLVHFLNRKRSSIEGRREYPSTMIWWSQNVLQHFADFLRKLLRWLKV